MLGRNYSAPFIGVAGIFFPAIFVIACHEPEQPGTPDQASASRLAIEDGKAFLDTVRAEMDVILTRLTRVQIAKDLLLPASEGGKTVISESEVIAAYGIYDEVSTDVFSFVADQTADSLRIQGLNGVDLTISNFKFSVETSMLTGFNWAVSSNNRVTTPAEEVLEINATGSRFVLSNQLLSILDFLKPSLVVLNGNVSYPRGTTVVHYYIDRGAVGLRASLTGSTVLEVSQSLSFRVWDVANTGGITTDAPNWRESETVNYRPVNLSGSWAVALRGVKYSDSTGVSLDTSVLYDADASSPGFAVYNGSGTASLVVANSSSSDERDGKRRRTSDSVWVAQVNGGPYTCNLSNPSDIGVGQSITLDWLDGIQTSVMPSTAISCANSVIYQPLQ